MADDMRPATDGNVPMSAARAWPEEEQRSRPGDLYCDDDNRGPTIVPASLVYPI